MTLTPCRHLVRVVSLDPSLLVPSKRIPRQVRVLLVQVVLGLVRLLRIGCLLPLAIDFLPPSPKNKDIPG